jgi:2-oxoglutarate ferredoxin oxidoreductase subunit beta
MNYLEYLKTEKFPHFWCKGCGNGVVLGAIARAFAELDLTKENTVIVTGIGCWGKADDYVKTNCFHGTHGRALAFATGIKLANPELHVIVLMGDGDGVTIGGNHYIHAARRNVDVTAVIVNNFNYGMTGGQYSGTTPEEKITTTSKYGHIEEGFDICALAQAAGAKFVARTSTDNVAQMKNLIVEGISKKGFASIEVISPCPTHFGRNNGMRTAADLIKWTKERSITPAQAARMSVAEKEGKLIMGKICDKPGIDYSTKYQKTMEKAGFNEVAL